MQMDKVLELQAVLLRNHPQMSYKGVPSWPFQVDLARRPRRQTAKRRSQEF